MKFINIFALLVCVGLILVTLGSKGPLVYYWDFHSLLITLGGTLTTLVASYSFRDLVSAFKLIFYRDKEATKSHSDIVNILLAIYKETKSVKLSKIIEYDELTDLVFFKDALKLIVDEIPTEQIPSILEKESKSMLYREKKASTIFGTASNISPLFGMIGTVLGLIAMLANLYDTETLPQTMSLALITTLYGLFLSVVFFRPISGKISERAEHYFLNRVIIIEGIKGMLNKKNSELLKTELEKIYVE